MTQINSTLALPTPEQIEWADREIGVIIHLDVQVFEPGYAFRAQWGHTPDASVFNPTSLDTDQWIATAKAAGATYAVLVAKHCSGFSLWPTEAHDYSVKSSPWKNGKGDIVADFFASCKKFGVKPGLYASVACNAYLNVDNPGTVRTGDPVEQARYNRIVEQQLTELWTNYGEVFYLWFDGGVLPVEQGGPAIVPLMRKLQPKAVLFQGPADWPSLTRFTGNERGEPPDPFWNSTNDLTSDDGTVEVEGRGGAPDGTRWVPGEADLPNRCQKRAFQGGWFWREGEDQFAYSRDHLVERYFGSIGRNTNLLIGMVIDPRGLVPESDRVIFEEFGTCIKQLLSKKLGSTSGTGTTITLPLESAPNMLILAEDIAHGERVRKFVVEALADGKWTKIGAGTVIGHKRIERFEPIRATQLRLTVLEHAGEPQIREFSAWTIDKNLLSVPLSLEQRCRISILRRKSGDVEIRCSSPSLSVRYTTDGSEPTAKSPIYEKPFPLPNGGVVKAFAFINEQTQSATATTTFGMDRSSWKIASVSLDSPFPNGGYAGVEHLLDDDPFTYWHTFHSDKTKSAAPHEVVFDMGAKKTLKAFTVTLRAGGTCEGAPDQVAFYLSDDGKNWTLAAETEFNDLREDQSMRLVRLPQPASGRYLRFVAKHVVDDTNYVVVAGIGVVE